MEGSAPVRPRRVIILAALSAGLMGLAALSIPLGFIPDTGMRTLAVSLEFSGTSPEEMERVVTRPLEEALGELRGLREVFSSSEPGRSILYLSFDPRVDLDTAYIDARDRIDRVYAVLPEAVQRPEIARSGSEDRPVMVISLPEGSYAEEDLKRRFERVDGVGGVEVAGAARPRIRIEVRMERAVGAGIPDILDAVRGANVAGNLRPPGERPLILDHRFRSLQDVENVRLGARLRLADLASVGFSDPRPERLSRIDGERRTVVLIRAAGDALVIPLCGRLRKTAAGLEGSQVLFDYGLLMERGLAELGLSLAWGVLLVSLITMALTRGIRYGLLAALAQPLALLTGTFGLTILGFRLDVLTIAGLACGSGMVVDGAIHFLSDWRLRGDPRAALRQVLPPVVAASAAVMAVFLPLPFGGKEVRLLLTPVAAALGFSLLGSLAYLVFVLPALVPSDGRTMTMTDASPRWDRILGRLARRRLLIGGVLGILVAAALAAASRLPVEGFDARTERTSEASLEFPPGTPVEEVAARSMIFEARLREIPGVERVSARFSAERAAFTSYLESGTREEAVDSRIAALARLIPEAWLYRHQPRETFQVHLSGSSFPGVRDAARSLGAEISRLAGVSEVVYHFKDSVPSVRLVMDKERSIAAGVSPSALGQGIYWTAREPVAAKWTSRGEERDIVVTLGSPAPSPMGLDMILDSLVPGASGLRVRDLVRVTGESTPGRITRLNQRPSVSLEIRPRSALAAVKDLARRTALAQDILVEVGRDLRPAEALRNDLIVHCALSFLVLALILASALGGVRKPLVALGTVLLTAVPTILAFRLIGRPLSLPATIGILIGLGQAVSACLFVLRELPDAGWSANDLAAMIRLRGAAVLAAMLTNTASVLPLLLPGEASGGILAPLALATATGSLGCLALGLLLMVAAAHEEPRGDSVTGGNGTEGEPLF